MAFRHGIAVTEIHSLGGGRPPGPMLVDLALPDIDLYAGHAVSAVLVGQTPGATLSIRAGQLPTGLVLDLDSGELTGTPAAATVSTLTIRQVLAGASNSPRDTDIEIRVAADPDEQIPTARAASVVIDGVTINFAEPYQVGWHGPKRPFVLNSGGVTITSITPASTLYTAASGEERSGWVHGAELNPGIEGSQQPGRLNRSMDSTSLHGLDERGSTSVGGHSSKFTGQGVSFRASPPELSAGGYVLNRDPGYTGSPIVIPAGVNAVIGKAVSDTAATSVYSRLAEYCELSIVAEAPRIGALPIGAARPDLGHRLYAEDIDLTGVHNLPPPAGFTLTAEEALAYLRKPLSQSLLLGTDSQRYNRGLYGGLYSGYGRDIARRFSDAAMLLHTNVPTPAEKAEIAYCFVAHALAVRDRIDAGGILSGATIGAQMHQWSAIIAVAAWLTRNSARGQILRDLLPGGVDYPKNLIHLSNPRVTERADWITKTPLIYRNTPGGGIKTYYEGLQCRPQQEGSVWGFSEPGPPGSGAIPARFDGGTTDYTSPQFLSNFGMIHFLALAPGGRATINRPEYWQFYDLIADIQIYHRQYGTGANSGLWYREGSILTRINWFNQQALADPAWQWQQPVLPAPTISHVRFTSFDALQEYGQSNEVLYDFKAEQWVWVTYSQHLSREVARMPVKSGITITVNGQAIAFDEVGCRTAGDPRTNGAIQIRGRAVAFALSGADINDKLGRLDGKLRQTDVVLVTTNYAADAASRPRTLDNQLVPDVAAAAATWISATAERPSALELVSFGGRTPDDAPKIIQVSGSTTFVSAKYDINSDTPIDHILVGARLKLGPGGISRYLNAGILGRNSGTTRSSLRFSGPGALISRYITNGPVKAGNAMAGWTAAHDNVEITLWWLATLPEAGGTNQVRRDNEVSAAIAMTGGPGVHRYGDLMSSTIGLLGFPGSNPAEVSQPLNASLREFYIAIGTARRPLGPVDLNDAVFSPEQDWGSRGQNVLPGRADYATHTDGGVPEFYFCPTLELARLNTFPNYGLFSLLAGTFNDPEHTATWVSGE